MQAVLSHTNQSFLGELTPSNHANNRCSTYFFGFNGKEKDTEWTGQQGSHLDFGARIYDSRIGRWLSVDPLYKDYESYSDYEFALNNPINNKDVGGSIVVDKNGNPVYTTNGTHSNTDKKSGITEYYERRVYYTNEGNEIHVNTLIKRVDKDDVEIEISASEKYICHGYTQLASREDYLNPDKSKHKTLLTAEYNEYDEDGGKINTYQNMNNILADDYEKLDVDVEEAMELSKNNKIVAIFNDSEGKAAHSALVNPNSEYSNYPFIAKFGETPFKPNPSGWNQNSVYNNEKLTFDGFYQYKGDHEIDIETENGYTDLSNKEVKDKVKQ
jgi:RHS repeat-associated protein